MIDQERLKSLMLYDPLTGVFTWRRREGAPETWNKQFAGRTAGHAKYQAPPRSYYYREIGIGNKRYRASHLAWLYMTGELPINKIDHANGDSLDDSWGNLREATSSENNCNSRLRSNNTTGFKGVTFKRSHSKYASAIRVAGKRMHLGYFETPEKAYAAYCEAARQYHGEYARLA